MRAQFHIDVDPTAGAAHVPPDMAWRQSAHASGGVLCMVAVMATLAPQIAVAQSITHGDANFDRTASSFDTTPAGNFRGITGSLASDQMFETGWAYRIGGDTREFFLPLPNTQNFAGDTSTITWADVAGRGLISARETVRVVDADGAGGAAPAGLIEMTMEVANISTGPIVVGMFHMADLDIAGDGANDVVTLLRPGPNPTIGISDGAVTAQYRGIAANRWQVRNYASGNGIGGLLDDAQLTTLSSSGAPGGPFDFTGGMQWTDRTIQPGASFSVGVILAVNAGVIGPELFVIKTNDVDGVTAVDEVFEWTLLMVNAGNSPTVTFAPGQLMLRDQLPASGVVYDAAVVTPIGGSSGSIECLVTVADLLCTAMSAVSIPGGGSVRVVLPAVPTEAGTLPNPRAGGSCRIDPDDHIEEEAENNNACSDTVIVVGASVFGDGFEGP